ncbi:MAG: ATP-binding cassette domain-containing protein [Alphaproteobacteria bacterium]|nr:ATP-binding cassette domain-containing protein [Alphaproteobacteria bacterium]
MAAPLLALEGLAKTYRRGLIKPRVTFSLHADFAIAEPAIIGVVGPNGAGKTTLFEMIAGSNLPSEGRVLVQGTDIHKVRYRERDRLAIHYHQSYQVRRMKRTVPSFMLETAGSDYPLVHLFDEPQFNVQDGYIGFMLDFFRALRARGRLVVVCLHPTARYHLEILKEICERYLFVAGGSVAELADFRALAADERVRQYFGADMVRMAESVA